MCWVDIVTTVEAFKRQGLLIAVEYQREGILIFMTDNDIVLTKKCFVVKSLLPWMTGHSFFTT